MTFLYVFIISVGGGIVAITFTKHDTFKSAAATFFGSVAFGSLIGGVMLAVYSKMGYVFAAACSLFGRKIYGIMGKKIPEKIAEKIENTLKP